MELKLIWHIDCVDHNKPENAERDGNIRPPDLPLEKSICRSASNSTLYMSIKSIISVSLMLLCSLNLSITTPKELNFLTAKSWYVNFYFMFNCTHLELLYQLIFLLIPISSNLYYWFCFRDYLYNITSSLLS